MEKRMQQKNRGGEEAFASKICNDPVGKYTTWYYLEQLSRNVSKPMAYYDMTIQLVS